jgi:hypothetical protein
LKDPIELPCEDCICREHLTERDVVKKNKIKCAECKQEFQDKDFNFKSCKECKKLIESLYKLNLKYIKEGFSSFVEQELKQIEETVRNPSLLITTIQDLQRNQEESLKDIQFNINQTTI